MLLVYLLTGPDTSEPLQVTTAPLGVTHRLFEAGILPPPPDPPPELPEEPLLILALKLVAASLRP